MPPYKLWVNWSAITRANGCLFQLQSSSLLVSLRMLVQVFQAVNCEAPVCGYWCCTSICDSRVWCVCTKGHMTSQRVSSTSNLQRQLHWVRSSMVMTLNSQHRDNTPASSTEDYYRITLYDEFLSHVVAEMKARFVNNPAHKLAIGVLYLLPTKCVSLSSDIIVPTELEKLSTFSVVTFPSSRLSTVTGSESGSQHPTTSSAPSTSSSCSSILPER